MNILIIGSNNSLAKFLVKKFEFETHNVSKLKNKLGNDWRFGNDFEENSFYGIDAIIFTSWNKSNLENSLNGLKQLLNFLDVNHISTNVIYISSYSIFNGTRYGLSKIFAEELLNSRNQSFVRIPLIIDNIYTKELSKLKLFFKILKFIPRKNVWGGDIFVTELEHVASITIQSLLEPLSKNKFLKDQHIQSLSIEEIFKYTFRLHTSYSNILSYFFQIFLIINRIIGSKNRYIDSIMSFFTNGNNNLYRIYKKYNI